MYVAEERRETQAPEGPLGPLGPLGPAIRDESQLMAAVDKSGERMNNRGTSTDVCS